VTLRNQLHEGAHALGLNLSMADEERLLSFLALMVKWNRTYNLTSIRDEADMVTQHLLDSLSVLPLLGHVKTLADVGSGAGLPGIPLAMVSPELSLASIESNQKKAAFQQQAKIEMHLENVSIHCCRVEGFKEVQSFDAVISRAFSSLADFVRLAGHLVGSKGWLLAMKGQRPVAEMDEIPSGWRVEKEQRLSVPGMDAERHLIVMKRV
jgi:16S rRNA (guanine527-N7)-methyltransferase